MLGHDPEELALLGYPTLEELMALYLVETERTNGASDTDMFKKYPKVPKEAWCVAGHQLLVDGNVRQEWSPVPQPAMEAQESRYFKRIEQA